jgi:hypothetical protein
MNQYHFSFNIIFKFIHAPKCALILWLKPKSTKIVSTK